MAETQTFSFSTKAAFYRRDVKRLAADLKLVINHLKETGIVSQKEDRAEMIENLTLAYRHLEDASMRVGKAIQAFDGGVSVYERDEAVGA